jgi:hypothetical protein
MLGLKRRKRVEGWAEDVPEGDEELTPATLGQRINDNTKLWFGALLVVLIITGYAIKNPDWTGFDATKYLTARQLRPSGKYNDANHTRFARDFVTAKGNGSIVEDAKFVGPGTFRIVVNGKVSRDDIDYVSKMAALKIYQKFNRRVVVRTYMYSLALKRQILMATTKWEEDKYGYNVKYERDAAKLL